MSVVVIITPPAKLVTLAEVKEHLRLDRDDGDHDATLNLHISAASRAVDGPTGSLGKSFAIQTLELRLDEFPAGACDGIDLPFGPLLEVISVTYADADGEDQTLVEGDDFAVVSGSTLKPLPGGAWPAARFYPDDVRIRYLAGHVADTTADPLVEAVPDNVRAACLLHVEILYDRPEGPALAALERTRSALLDLDRVLTV